MAWYQVPIRPFDPLNPEDQPTPPQHYVRDSFAATGQDSHTRPPAEDQSQWVLAQNVMPITKGTIERRWGYDLFATNAIAENYLTNFQRDSDNLRTILASSDANVQAFTETGTSYNASVFNPVAINGGKVRSLTSRSYQYFFDGNAADLVKWDGSASGGVTNWGINIAAGTAVVTAGPSLGGSIQSAIGWTNAGNANTNGGAYATFPLSGATQYVNPLTTGTYGFTLPGTAIVQGFQVSVTAKAPGLTGAFLDVFMVKAGTIYGFGLGPAQNVGSGATTLVFGGPTSLTGSGWSAAQVNATNFGVQIKGGSASGTGTYEITDVTVTVYYIPTPNSITVTDGGTGTINLTVGRIYYCVFQNSTSGQLSDLNSPSASTGPLTNQLVTLSTIPVSSDPQVDTKVILATADGGDPSTLYFVTELPNATTTYVDETPDTTLIFNQVYLSTDQFGNEFGVSQNTPPTTINGLYAIKFQGRLWMASAQNIFFSKSVDELTVPNGFICGKYEECWPLDNYFDISEGAETVSGLLTDGTTLYIGTQSHIRRLVGNDPTNFEEPQIVHPQVGLINQEVWQIVYTEGSPSGCIWMTPDFRVLASDFNTYTDIGTSIQDVLNSLQPEAASLAHAMFVSDGEYDLYILAVPVTSTTYCDTHLVYDMRNQHWFVWTPANGSLSVLFNINAAGEPQWLFLGGLSGADIWQYQESASTDTGSAIDVIARTSWMHLGEPSKRKVLDELEITGDPNMVVAVFGASTTQDFDSPVTVISNATPVLSPFGQYKVYLATKTSKYRYYQLQFKSFDGAEDVLDGFNLRFIPWNAL